MLKGRSDSALALVLFLGLGSYATWHEYSSSRSVAKPSADKHQSSEKRAEIESVQDIAAETVAYYTKVLAWFTGILALVSGIQGYFLLRADGTARVSAEAAKLAAETAEKQILLTGRHVDVVEKQHAVGRLQFFTDNRPRIRIRHVWLKENIELNRPVTVEIIYVNIGDTKAQVLSFGIDFNVLWPKIPLPGNLTPHPRPGVPLPKCGLGETQSTGNVATLALMDSRVGDIRDGSRTLCCFGFLEYSDIGPEETRKIRRTSFCRMFVPTNNPIEGIGRFVLPDKPDPDYEYED